MSAIHEDIEREDEAIEKIVGFVERFGAAHARLASHAAVPLTLTPDLLYQLWATFTPEVPFVAVSDILLGALTRDVGHELFEIGPHTREMLLKQLSREHGEVHVRQVANFVLAYVEQTLRQDLVTHARRIQGETVNMLAFLDPQLAGDALASVLSRTDGSQPQTPAHVARLADTLATQLGETQLERIQAMLPDGLGSANTIVPGAVDGGGRKLGDHVWALFIAPDVTDSGMPIPNGGDAIESTVRGLAVVLQQRLAVPDHHLRFAFGKTATKAHIFAAIDQHFINNPAVQYGAELWIHLDGLGGSSAQGNTRGPWQYFVAGSTISDPTSMLSFDELDTALRKLVQSKGANLLITLDVPGSALPKSASVPYTWLAASPQDEVIFVNPADGTSPFTPALRDALSGLGPRCSISDLLNSIAGKLNQPIVLPGQNRIAIPQLGGHVDRWAFGMHPFMPISMRDKELQLHEISGPLVDGCIIDIYPNDVRFPTQLATTAPLLSTVIAIDPSGTIRLNRPDRGTKNIPSNALAVLREPVKLPTRLPDSPNIHVHARLPAPLIANRVQRIDITLDFQKTAELSPTVPARARKKATKSERPALALPTPVIVEVTCLNAVIAPTQRSLIVPDGTSTHTIEFLIAPELANPLTLMVNVRSGDTLLHGASFTTASQVATEARPTGMAVHIGLNRVDPAQFNGYDGELLSPENDALSLAEITQRRGFVQTKLLTEDATKRVFAGVITLAARTLVAGDLFICTFSGHGEDSKAGTAAWVFFDGSLLMREFGELLAAFAPNVRVVCIPDGGASLRWMGEGARDVSASILSLEANDENLHLGTESREHGAFTAAILERLNVSEVVDTWATLHDALRKASTEGKVQLREFGNRDLAIADLHAFAVPERYSDIERNERRFERGHALLIGMFQSRFAPGMSLQVISQDLYQIAATLRSTAACGYRSKNIETLTAKTATKQKLLDSFERLAAVAERDPDAVLFVYVAGIAVRLANQQVYLLTEDTLPDEAAMETALSIAQLQQQLERIRSTNLFVVVDTNFGFQSSEPASAAYSTKEVRSQIPMSIASLTELLHLKTPVLFSNRRQTHDGQVESRAQASIFAQSLIEALSGKASPPDAPEVNVTAVGTYVAKQVAKLARSQGNSQAPMFQRGRGDDFPIGLNRGGHGEPARTSAAA